MNESMTDRIKSFAALKEGWNSYESRTISKIAIDAALKVAPLFEECEGWGVYPTPDGGILFEGNDADLFEFTSEGTWEAQFCGTKDSDKAVEALLVAIERK